MKIRIIDYEYLWKEDGNRTMFSKREVIPAAYKIFNEADITLIRPGMIKVSGIAPLSIFYYHHKEIKKQIKEFEPDVIIAFGILNAYIGMKHAKKNDIHFVYYLIDHLHALLPAGVMQKTAKQFEKKTIEGADRIFVINKGLKDYAIQMGGNSDKISIIPAGVDIEQFNPQVDGASIREKYGVLEDDILLFFMGWIYDFSGMKEVAESLLKNEVDKIKLMVVGEGDLYELLLRMKSVKDVNGKLILTGKVPFDQIAQYIAAADICLLPAIKNDIMMNIVPIKMYEYMAMGKPIIATNLPGIQKEFGSSNGVSYVDKPEEVLEKSLWLYSTNKIREEGAKAHSYTRHLSWDNIVDQFETQLEGLVNNENVYNNN